MVALVAATHPLAGQAELVLDDLANEGFLLFPRELAPRLYDVMVGLCRHAGFEPVVRDMSFHAGWELGVLADVHVVALVPQSVTSQLPPGVVALRLSDPSDRLDTALVWRSDQASAVAAAFREAARVAFAAGDTSSV